MINLLLLWFCSTPLFCTKSRGLFLSPRVEKHTQESGPSCCGVLYCNSQPTSFIHSFIYFLIKTHFLSMSLTKSCPSVALSERKSKTRGKTEEDRKERQRETEGETSERYSASFRSSTHPLMWVCFLSLVPFVDITRSSFSNFHSLTAIYTRYMTVLLVPPCRV